MLLRSTETEQPKPWLAAPAFQTLSMVECPFFSCTEYDDSFVSSHLEYFFLSFLQHECCLNSKIISFSKVLNKTCIEYVIVIYYLGEDLKGG